MSRTRDGLEIKEGEVLDAEGRHVAGVPPHGPYREGPRVRVIRLGPVGGTFAFIALLGLVALLLTAGAAMFALFVVGLAAATIVSAVLSALGVGKSRR